MTDYYNVELRVGSADQGVFLYLCRNPEGLWPRLLDLSTGPRSLYESNEALNGCCFVTMLGELSAAFPEERFRLSVENTQVAQDFFRVYAFGGRAHQVWPIISWPVPGGGYV